MSIPTILLPKSGKVESLRIDQLTLNDTISVCTVNSIIFCKKLTSVKGRDLVSYLMISEYVRNREDAVRFGQHVVELQLLVCITNNENLFKDDKTLYRFKTDMEELKRERAVGKQIGMEHNTMIHNKERTRSEADRTKTLKFKDTSKQSEFLMSKYEQLIITDNIIKYQPNDLVIFPKEDLTVKVEPQQHRIYNAGVPMINNNNNNNIEDITINEMLNIFTQSYNVVQYNYSQYDGKQLYDYTIDVNTLIELPYYLDVEYLDESTDSPNNNNNNNNSSLQSMFNNNDNNSNNTTTGNKEETIKKYILNNAEEKMKERNNNRVNLFDNTVISEAELPLSDLRVTPAPYQSKINNEITVSLKEFSFEIGDIEPYYLTIGIYDIHTNQRLSELFHLNIYNEVSNVLLNIQPDKLNKLTTSKEGIFEIEECNPNYYLVVLVEKVLQGDIDVVIDNYNKANTMKKDKKIKIVDETRVFCNSLGNYKQLLAWGVVPLFFNSTEKLNLPIIESKTNGNTVYRADVDLLGAKNESIIPFHQWNDKEFKKLKSIPSKCTLQIEFKPIHPYPISPPTSPVVSSKSSNSNSNYNVNETTNKEVVEEEKIVRFNSSLSYINPIPTSTIDEIDTNANSKFRFQRELKGFKYGNAPEFTPYLNFSNNLYIYPQSVNLSSTSGRNIAIQVSLFDNDDLSANSTPLSVFYSPFGSSELFVNKLISSVTYHLKKPYFYDEYKLKIPFKLQKSYHLLFTFYHISCKVTKDKKKQSKQEQIQTVLGYSYLPIFQDEKIIEDKEYNLPISVNIVPGYLQTNKQNEMKWLDNKKGLFTVKTKLDSTVLTQDTYLNNFYKLIINRNNNNQPLDEKTLLNQLSQVSPQECVKHFGVIMKLLYTVFILPKSEMEAKTAFLGITSVLRGVQLLAKKENQSFDCTLFQYYVTYMLDTNFINNNSNNNSNTNGNEVKTIIHEELSKGWLIALKTSTALKQMFDNNNAVTTTNATSGTTSPTAQSPTLSNNNINNNNNNSSIHNDNNNVIDITWQFSSFWFSCIIKCMILTLNKENKIENKVKETRNDRFSKEYITTIALLIECLIDKLLQLEYEEQYLNAKMLNTNLAYFIKDLLHIIDRGIVFTWINYYLLCINSVNDSQVLQEFKLNFLNIIINFEHYIPLNLPIDIKIVSLKDIQHEFSEKHYLSGIILKEISTSFETCDIELRQQCLLIIRNIIRKHDLDKRYQSKMHKQQISGIYFPMLIIILNNLQAITKLEVDERKYWILCVTWLLKHIDRSLLRNWYIKETKQRKLQFLLFLSLTLDNFEHAAKVSIIENTINWKNKGSVNSFKSSSKLAAINVLQKQRKEYIESIYGKLLLENNSYNINNNSSNFNAALTMDKNPVLRKFAINKNEMGTTSNYNMSANGTMSPTTIPIHSNNNSKDTISKINTATNSIQMNGSKEMNNVMETLALSLTSNTLIQDGYLCKEIHTIVLDLMVDIINDLTNDIAADKSYIMRPICQLFVLLLQKNQCLELMTIVFNTLQWFLLKFKHSLFHFVDNSICLTDISFELLRLCNSKTNQVRMEATTMIYLLIRYNYDELQSIGKMKLNIAINLSKLVGNAASNIATITDFQYLKKALEDILDFSIQHKNNKETFVEQLELSMKRLFTVIRDSNKLYQYRFDIEMTSDLIYQISNGYLDSPELRVTWLSTLFANYLDRTNWEEAGQTGIHIASLVNEYLCLQNPPLGYPGGKLAMLPISPNVLFEPPLDLSSKEQGKVDSPYFTESGLLSLLSKSILLFKKAELFELCIEVYNIIVAIHQKNYEYDKLVECYSDLSTISKTLHTVQHNRFYPTYYRVGFYGSIFGDLNGVEYVYKEPKGTLLPEFVDRFKKQIEQQFGSTDIIVLPNTHEDVDISKLDNNKCYLQVVSCQIYLDEDDLKQRVTPFQTKFNVDRFIFETPFTKSGNAITEDVAEQYKMKTIIQTELKFPYLKKRLKVINKKKLILTPIENAIELLESRNNSFITELNANPPNIKNLQSLLHGSVLARVNVGPIKFSEVFLGQADKYPEKDVKKLREVVNNFLIFVARGIDLNSKLIKEDQLEFHQELESGFRDIKQQMLTKFMSPRQNVTTIVNNQPKTGEPATH